MTRASLIASFRSSLNAGESRRQAHETVTNEIDSLLGELLENGCETGDVSSLMQWWCNLDYRAI